MTAKKKRMRHTEPPRVKRRPGWGKALGPNLIRKLMDGIGDDGHSIYAVTALTDNGVPEEIARSFVMTHHTGKNPKEMIWTSEGVAKSSMGVYGLEVLCSLARDLGVKFNESFPGRGFLARSATRAILDWCVEQEKEVQA